MSPMPESAEDAAEEEGVLSYLPHLPSAEALFMEPHEIRNVLQRSASFAAPSGAAAAAARGRVRDVETALTSPLLSVGDSEPGDTPTSSRRSGDVRRPRALSESTSVAGTPTGVTTPGSPSPGETGGGNTVTFQRFSFLLLLLGHLPRGHIVLRIAVYSVAFFLGLVVPGVGYVWFSTCERGLFAAK